MFRTSITTALVLTFLTAATAGTPPERDKGISMHLLPKRVAEISGKKWGLVYDPSQEALQTPDEFLSLVRRQPRAVQDNGVWIVVTDPDAYGEQEKELLTDVETLCRKEKIVLFVARAADLPHGWKRVE